MKIIVYKLTSCGFCKKLLEALGGEGMEHEVRSVSDPDNTEDCNKMDALFGTARYPKVVIKKDNDTIFVVPNDATKLPDVPNIKIHHYSTPQDVINVIKQIS